MELNCSKGDRVILTDNCSQIFEGDVKNVNHDLGRLLLKNVIQHPGKLAVEGYRHFDRNEIANIVNINESCPKLNFSNKNNSAKGKETIQENDSNSNKIPELQYCFIKNFDKNFYDAVSKLKQCSKIGLHVRDVSKGRFNRASVIAMSTNSIVYIFDLLILSDEIFNRGLKDILESPNIVKVVYDCRLLSDCLSHKHSVNLMNVRDVEAEDIMVVFQDRNGIRNHSRSLQYLIKIYLHSDFNDITDSEVWNKRPLSGKNLKFLSSLVTFLIPLHEAVEKKYLEKLISASDIYNHYVRNFDVFEFVQMNVTKTLQKPLLDLVSSKKKPRTNDFKFSKTA